MSTLDDRVVPDTSCSVVHQEDKFSSKETRLQTSVPAKVDSNDFSDEDNFSCGSLDLGKHRQQDAPVTTDPERHVTQRASSKEFHFPKSN